MATEQAYLDLNGLGTFWDCIKESLLDLYYPVGSYYETSDTSFDPNAEWGGTWILEAAGQVHVSAGTGYSVNGAISNVSDGGATTYTVPTTKLNDANIAHGHGFTQPTIPNHKHSFTQPTIPNHKHSFTQPTIPNHKHSFTQPTVKGGGHQHGFNQHDNAGSGAAYVVATSSSQVKFKTHYVDSDGGHTHTVSGGAVGNPSSLPDCTGGAVGNPSSLPACTGGAVGNPSSLPDCTGGAVSNLSGASSTRTAHGHGDVSTMQPYIIVNRWHRVQTPVIEPVVIPEED